MPVIAPPVPPHRLSRRRRRRRPDDGFTLLELLVVLVILGLLAAFAVPQVMDYLGRSKVDAARIQLQRLDSIMDLYRLDMGRYPNQQEGLQALVAAPADAARWAGPYLKNADSLIDPWGTPYGYRIPGENGTYDLYTLGADQAPGGEGENQDLSN